MYGHVVELFGLVGRVAALCHLAHSVAFDRLDKNDRRLAFVSDGCRKCSVDFVRIVATTVQTPDVIVRHAGDHFEQLRVLTKEMLANICTVICFVVLILTIYRVHHDLLQDSILIFR